MMFRPRMVIELLFAFDSFGDLAFAATVRFDPHTRGPELRYMIAEASLRIKVLVTHEAEGTLMLGQHMVGSSLCSLENPVALGA